MLDVEDEFFRVLKYLNEEDFYCSKELWKLTNGFSETRAFRSYLRVYVKNFKPEPIREGKRYELVLRECGRFGVRYTDGDQFPVTLSETERVIFRYLCFLHTAEFWYGFEQIRNLHSIKKPLIIDIFLERLDESFYPNDLIQRTLKLKRQLIII